PVTSHPVSPPLAAMQAGPPPPPRAPAGRNGGAGGPPPPAPPIPPPPPRPPRYTGCRTRPSSERVAMSAPSSPAPARPWSSRAEPVGLAAWAAAAVAWGAWCWFGEAAFGPLHLVTAVGLALALALFARRGWVRLFGPVLLYEALRSARRPRFFLLRWLYAVGLLLLLLWVHSIWSMETRYRGDVAI